MIKYLRNVLPISLLTSKNRFSMKLLLTLSTFLVGSIFSANVMANINYSNTTKYQDFTSYHKLKDFNVAKRSQEDGCDLIKTLENNKQLIFSFASKYTNEVHWQSVKIHPSINDCNDVEEIKVDVDGKLGVFKSGSLTVSLFLKRDTRGIFKFSQYKWSQKDGICGFSSCSEVVKDKLKDLPSKYEEWNRALDEKRD